jgi:hypothetical protein
MAVNQPEKGDKHLSIFPNPASHEFNFQYQNIGNKLIKLSIYNTEGKLMKKLECETGSHGSAFLTWNPVKQHSQEGIYLYHSVISSGKEMIEENGKIIYKKN